MPRLNRLDPTQGDPQAQQMLAQLEGQKMLLNIFRGMANSPAVLDGYLKLNSALKAGKLDAKTRHAIALIVGQTNRCDYCLAAHTMLGKGAGLDDGAVRDARLGRSSDKKTNAAVVLAKQLLDKKGNVSNDEIAAAKSAGLSDGEVGEVVANVALNIFTNYFNHVNQPEVLEWRLYLDRLRRAGGEFDGLLEVGHGLVQAPLIQEDAAEVCVGDRECRVEFDGLAVLGDGLVQLPLSLQGVAQPVVGRGIATATHSPSRLLE